mgnify:CR=1 FL=1
MSATYRVTVDGVLTYIGTDYARAVDAYVDGSCTGLCTVLAGNGSFYVYPNQVKRNA